MMRLGTQRVNHAGHLEIGGCDAVELAEQFGTPLYVVDEQCFRDNCRAWRAALAAVADSGELLYAGKALLTVAVARLVADEGLGLDVASGGELAVALQAGIDPARIVFHGNYKSAAEIAFAHDAGVGRVVVDSLDELDQWAALGGRPTPVLVRVNPNVKPKTHTAVQVGQIDSKFGLSIGSGQALAACWRATELDGVEFLGLHMHIGSQVLGWQAFAAAAVQLADLMAAIREATAVDCRQVNLGGGLGIRYLPEHDPPPPAEFCREVVGAFDARRSELGLPAPRLLIEPGRSIAGEAGLTLYRVGPIKEIPGVRTYLSVDGGLSDNPRPEMYGAEYHCFIADRADAEPNRTVTVAGKHCETDTLFRDVALADPRPGDLLAVQSTGAYCHSMASNYNRLCRPAMVLVADGRAELIVRRETYDDLLRCELLPERLRSAR